MLYKPGDTVVHPLHGAGTIKEITTESIDGISRLYYVFISPTENIKVMIPVDTAQVIGVREVMEEDQALELISSFSQEEPLSEENWNRRYRSNMLKLKSGEPSDIAEVLRSLMVRENEKGLSAWERRMMATAKQILISELSVALGQTFEQIEEKLADCIC
ncbi:MAG: CarD family transcriptional regulator [Clostridiales bacterium]|nr:CarD family transcriptional regulator [Clostridiales bacterium]